MSKIEYKCSKCNASNVKLWRRYQSGCFDLTCLKHFSDEEVKKFEKGETDQMGGFVPAILRDDDDTSMWGYTSVPKDRIAWWTGLPNAV